MVIEAIVLIIVHSHSLSDWVPKGMSEEYNKVKYTNFLMLIIAQEVF